MIKLWSETKPEIKRLLKPDLVMRSWDDLNQEEKLNIWFHLAYYFFKADINRKEFTIENLFSIKYPDDKKFLIDRQSIIIDTIEYFNNSYMANCYTPCYSQQPDGVVAVVFASVDFFNIFFNKTEDVVMELFSVYAKFLYKETEGMYKHSGETEDEFLQRKINKEYWAFDKFSEKLNEIFLQYAIKWCLTRDGFIPRQDEKIIEEIYNPVLHYLSDPKWQKVNTILSDAFSYYRKNTPQGYSGCLTNTIAAVEAYLQILVKGKTGKSTLSNLITEAQNKNMIPNDVFTVTVFKNIEAIFARERMATGDAHPKDEYATEKNARTILNLAMIFIQHCAQK
jgi:hypothetical protein